MLKFSVFSRKLYLVLLLVFTNSICMAAETFSVDKVLEKYSSVAGIKAEFQKTDSKKTLGLNQTAAGTLNYSAGKINIVIQSDRKSEIIFNGKKLWIIDYPDLDFDPKGKRKVTEMSDHKPALAQQLVNLFKSPDQFKQNFKVINKKDEGKFYTVEYNSKDKSIKNFKIQFNTFKNLINTISFTDDVQTETTIEFKKTEFLKKAPAGIFEYKRNKNDEVM